MRKINDEGDIRELNITDLIAEFQIDVQDLDSDDIDDTEYQLITNQYAYVKFGLILEKIRNRSWWRKCSEKFSDFRSFCQSKVNLNIWQVANAIKSAQVAVKIAWLGFTELPRNASQALKMSELSIERLGEVWGNVVASCAGHKITALAIESQINPDKPVTSETLRLPAHIADALRRQAIERGLTLTQYLEQLATGEPEEEIEIDTMTMTVDPEMAIVMDSLDRKFRGDNRPPLDRLGDRFDELLTGLVGQFIPPVRRVANE
jgi:hypothetical protein